MEAKHRIMPARLLSERRRKLMKLCPFGSVVLFESRAVWCKGFGKLLPMVSS